jgi:hypothetical protein
MNSSFNEENEELEIINPDTIPIKPIRRTTRIDFEQDEKEVITEITDYKSSYNNYGSTVKIDLESSGRFGNPKTIVLKDYNARHVNDLVTSKEEDLLETLISILNECVIEPKGFDIGNLTNEEFYEVLIGMKIAFDSVTLKHKWIHEDDSCQGKKEDDEKEISESILDLREIKSISIEESDEGIREFYKDKFSQLSEKDFKEYLLVKYGHEKDITLEEELKSIRIQEPFLIKGYETDYEFKLVRMKDLLLAYKIASRETNHKIRVIQNKTIKKGDNSEILKLEKEDEIKKLNREKARKVLEYSQAFSLSFVRRNGKRVELKTNEEKLKEYNTMPRNVLLNYMNAINVIRYGINDEIHLTCDLCNGTERGYLQRLISPFSLLPISEDKRDITTGIVRQHSGFNFYF